MRIRRLLATLVLLTVAGCGGGSGDSAEEDTDDAPAELACAHFRNVAGDASSGLLTDAELREKLKEVHDNARLSDTPEIRQHSEAMLAAVTQGDTESASDAISSFSEACSDLGY